jgi:hypothetical protein
MASDQVRQITVMLRLAGFHGSGNTVAETKVYPESVEAHAARAARTLDIES